MNLAEKLTRAIARAMDHAGTMPAKDAVKIHPNDWRAVVDHGREAAALIASQAARIRELEEGLEPFAKAGGVKLCGEWRDDERFGHTDVTFYLTFGDLRRAHSLLPRKGGE